MLLTDSTRDHGPPERWQHGDEAIEVDDPTDKSRAGNKPLRVQTQTPLDRYWHREQITKRQYLAGEKFYQLWRSSGREPRVTASYAPPVEHAGIESDGQADRYIQFLEAMRDGAGLTHSAILVHVCLCGISAGDWARMKGLRRQEGIKRLKDALDALARYWRL